MNRATRCLRFYLVAIFFAALVPVAGGTIIPVGTPIPAAEVVHQGNLDWVYAGPVAPNESAPGEIQLPSYRASEGWRFATASEWAVKPLWTDFIKPGFTQADVTPSSTWNDHTKYRFTSEYWSSQFTWVDLNDAAAGSITNGLNIGQLHSVWETWYVRSVPEPASVAIALSMALVLGASQRLPRRRRV